jgi:hypothetical protein
MQSRVAAEERADERQLLSPGLGHSSVSDRPAGVPLQLVGRKVAKKLRDELGGRPERLQAFAMGGLVSPPARHVEVDVGWAPARDAHEPLEEQAVANEPLPATSLEVGRERIIIGRSTGSGQHVQQIERAQLRDVRALAMTAPAR